MHEQSHLGKRSKTICRTTCIRNNVHFWVVCLLIHSYHKHWSISRWSWYYYFLGTSLQSKKIKLIWCWRVRQRWKEWKKQKTSYTGIWVPSNVMKLFPQLWKLQMTQWHNQPQNHSIGSLQDLWNTETKFVQTINTFLTFTLIIRYQLMIPFAHNFNLLSINFQSRVIQNFNGPLEWTMSRIIFKHVSLQEKDSMIKKNVRMK